MNHTDLALETGITPEQITETVKVVSSVVGLSKSGQGNKSAGTSSLDAKRRRALLSIKEYFGVIPEVFSRKIVVEGSELAQRFSRCNQAGPRLANRTNPPNT